MNPLIVPTDDDLAAAEDRLAQAMMAEAAAEDRFEEASGARKKAVAARKTALRNWHSLYRQIHQIEASPADEDPDNETDDDEDDAEPARPEPVHA